MLKSQQLRRRLWGGDTAHFSAGALDDDVVIESVTFSFKPEEGHDPNIMLRGIHDGDSTTHIANVAGGFEADQMTRTNHAWIRVEEDFGEVATQDSGWSLNVTNMDGAEIQEASVQVYGYNAGGLMHQMMDYAKEIAPSPGMPNPNAKLSSDVVATPVQDTKLQEANPMLGH